MKMISGRVNNSIAHYTIILTSHLLVGAIVSGQHILSNNAIYKNIINSNAKQTRIVHKTPWENQAPSPFPPPQVSPCKMYKTPFSIGWNICKLCTVLGVSLGATTKLREDHASPIVLKRAIVAKVARKKICLTPK